MTTSAAEFRIPKRAFTAEVTLAGVGTRSLRFFLSDSVEGHAGPERPSDLLESAPPFIPAVNADSGEVLLLGTNQILVFTVPAEEEQVGEGLRPEDLDSEGTVECRVEVSLADGATIRGEIRYLMPEGQRRLQDFLNATGRFLALRDGPNVVFVGKHHIVRVTSSRPT